MPIKSYNPNIPVLGIPRGLPKTASASSTVRLRLRILIIRGNIILKKFQSIILMKFTKVKMLSSVIKRHL